MFGDTVVRLRFNQDGVLCDGSGDALTLTDTDAVPGATMAPAMPTWVDANRRTLGVRVDQQRTWGRAGRPAVPATVIEWLPLQQTIRGGDGLLEFTKLAVGREATAPVAVHGGIVPAPANAALAPLTLAPARLPRFRVLGTNPTAAQLTTLVERVPLQNLLQGCDLRFR